MRQFDEHEEKTILLQFRRLADAFSSSPLLSGQEEEITYQRSELPVQAIRLVSDFLGQLDWPILPLLTYRGMRTATRDEETLPQDADAQVLLSAKVFTVSGVRNEIDIPVFVRKNKLLEPSVALVNGSPRILSQSLVDELITAGTWSKKIDPRGGMFGPPLTSEARDLYMEMDPDLKEEKLWNRGMYSVAQITPRVDQVLKEVETLKAEGYDDVDAILLVHQKYPTIADTVIDLATEKGLLDDTDDGDDGIR